MAADAVATAPAAAVEAKTARESSAMEVTPVAVIPVPAAPVDWEEGHANQVAVGLERVAAHPQRLEEAAVARVVAEQVVAGVAATAVAPAAARLRRVGPVRSSEPLRQLGMMRHRT